MKTKIITPAVCVLAAGICQSVNAKNPNIILFLVDDQGWYQSPLKMVDSLDNSKSDFIENMPNYIRFSQEAARFTQAYSAAPISGPSRACIQTGKSLCQLKYTELSNWEEPSSKRKLIAPTPDFFLPDEETTIAEMIKEINPTYRTAHFGKWHCDDSLKGNKWPNGKQGYDYHDGEHGNSGPAYYGGANPKDIFGITDRAIGFITEQVESDRPFYLQISHYALHNPPIAREETLAKYRKDKSLSSLEQQWAAVAEELDTGFGMIIDCIRKLGIEGDTYIFWMSDNGIPNPATARRNNLPLRGTKLTLWEGGIRVPLLARGPQIHEGVVIDTPVVGYDLFPTFCDIVSGGKRVKMPDELPGGSFLKLLKGKKSSVEGRSEELYFHYPHYRGKNQVPSSAIVQGDWKMLKNYETNQYLLFNLKEDLLERDDLSKEYPQKYDELKTKLDDFLKKSGALMPINNPDYRPQ